MTPTSLLKKRQHSTYIGFSHSVCAGLMFWLHLVHLSPDFMVTGAWRKVGEASVSGEFFWGKLLLTLSALHFFPNLPLLEFYFWSQKICVNKNALHPIKKVGKDVDSHFSKEDVNTSGAHEKMLGDSGHWRGATQASVRKRASDEKDVGEHVGSWGPRLCCGNEKWGTFWSSSNSYTYSYHATQQCHS